MVATIRSPSTSPSSLSSLPHHSTSRLIVLPLNVTSPFEPAYTSLPSVLKSHGIQHLNVIIANAGASPGGFHSIIDTPLEDITSAFETNTLAVIKLFKALGPELLLPDQPQEPQGEVVKGNGNEKEKMKKFILITSSVGSIGGLEEEGFPSLSYGISKVGANWFAKKLHGEFSDKGLGVGIVHPG